MKKIIAIAVFLTGLFTAFYAGHHLLIEWYGKPVLITSILTGIYGVIWFLFLNMDDFLDKQNNL